MPDVAAILLNIVGPVALMVALGALLQRRFALDLPTLTKLNIYLFTPAFVFDKVSNSAIDPAAMGGVVLVTAAQVLALGGIVWAVGRLAGAARASVSAAALATMIYNSGNYGLPLAELAYPAVAGRGGGGEVQAFVLLAMNVLTFTVGLAVAAGAESASYAQVAVKMLRLPVLYTLVAAGAVRWWAGDAGLAALPAWVGATSGYLAGGLVPVALVTLGAQLAGSLRRPRWRPVSLVLLLRLGYAPAQMAAGLFVLHRLLPGTFLDLWPWPAGVLVLTAATPTAVNTLLLTLELDGDADLAADCVFWTTVLSVATVTLWLAAIRAFGG